LTAPIRSLSWAKYTVIASDGGQLDVSLRRVPFDLEAIFAALGASGIPAPNGGRATGGGSEHALVTGSRIARG
jgi:hypothetical protein